jgi:hypothetical protein
METRRKIGIGVAALTILSLVVGAYSIYSGRGANAYHVNSPSTGALANPLYMRLRPLDTQYTSCRDACWVLPQYDAQQIISMISSLRPTVLERYTSGVINPSLAVPVCSGCAPMNAGEFLNASMATCQCAIWPRLALPANGNLSNFEAQAQSLMNLPIFPKFTVLAIDLWSSSAPTYTKSQIISMFQALESQGWTAFDLNDCGGYVPAYGYMTYGDVCLDTGTWQEPAQNVLSQMRTDNVQPLLYIDFPSLICKFITEQTTAQQFNDWKGMAANQASQGYALIYMVVQPLPEGNCPASTSGYYDSNDISSGGQTQTQLFESLSSGANTTSSSTTDSSSTRLRTSSTSTSQSSTTSNPTTTSTLSVSSSTTLSTGTSSSSLTTSSAVSTRSTVMNTRASTTITRAVTKSSAGTSSSSLSTSESTSSISRTPSSQVLGQQAARTKTAAVAMGAGTGAVVFLAGLFPLSYLFTNGVKLTTTRRTKHPTTHTVRYERARLGGH